MNRRVQRGRRGCHGQRHRTNGDPHAAGTPLEIAHLDPQLGGLRSRTAHLVAQQFGLVEDYLGGHRLTHGVRSPAFQLVLAGRHR